MNSNNPMSNIPSLGQPTAGLQPAGSGKFKPIDPIRVLRGNWLWFAFALVAGLVIGMGVWYGMEKYLHKYTSTAQYDVQPQNMDMTTLRNSSTTPFSQLEPLILREVENAKAEPLLREVLNSPAVQKTNWFAQFNNDMDQAYEDLSENVLNSGTRRSTPLFTVSATTPNKNDAQIILSAHRDEFIRRQTARINSQSERDLQAAQRRKDTAEERITSIRGQITRFLNNTPLEDIDGQTDTASLQVRYLTAKLGDLTENLGVLEATHQQLLARQEAGDFSPRGEERQFIENMPSISNINNSLLQLQVSREPLMEKFKSGHRVIKELDAQILKLEREKKAKYDEIARGLFDAKIDNATSNLEVVRETHKATSNELTKLRIRREELVRLRQEYDTLVRELEQAQDERVIATKTIEQLRVMDLNDSRVIVRVAVPPQKAKKSFPPHPAVVVSGSTLLITGIVVGLIFLREATDQRVRSASDVDLVPDATLLGMIPAANEDQGGNGSIDRVVEKNPAGLLAESFRQVRTAVLSKIDRRGYKTMMMVSAKAGAGVTESAHNLATSCALSGKRVLLIDANFRRPGLAKLMGVSGRPGLADLLQGFQSIDQADTMTQQGETPGLFLLPAGDCANAPLELFETSAFRELLAKLEADFDLLIIDTPPALLTSDAKLLSRHIDAIVLLARSQTDTRGMLQRLYRELDGQRADILGTILNGVQASAGGYLKRNYREFQDYSGPERRKAARATVSASNGSSTTAPNLQNGQSFSGSDAFDSADDDEKS